MDSKLRTDLGRHGDVVEKERGWRDFGSDQMRDQILHLRPLVTVGRQVEIAMRYHVLMRPLPPRPVAQDPFWRPSHVSSSRVRIRMLGRILDEKKTSALRAGKETIQKILNYF